jgi:hypothetical protein
MKFTFGILKNLSFAEVGFNLRSWNSNNESMCHTATDQGVFDIDKIVKILGLR